MTDDYKLKRNEYWRKLRAAWFEYQNSHNEHQLDEFNKFMESRYGLRVNMTGGSIDSSYQIVDEKKHNLFLLKYT
jgi:hypothetical protein